MITNYPPLTKTYDLESNRIGDTDKVNSDYPRSFVFLIMQSSDSKGVKLNIFRCHNQ